jgi:5-methylcytosine-specific restriction protein B
MSRFNPHFPNAAQVFDAADKFKQRCLLNQESLFLDGQTLWTPEHFKSLIENYVDRPDTGDRGFYEKLADQLATCAPLDVALMSEVFWIVQLGPTNLRAPTKIKTVERIWNMKPAAPFPMSSPFLEIPVLSGLGSAGPGYNNYLPMEIIFAVDAFAAFVAKPRAERESLLNDAQGFAKWLESIPSGKGRQLYHTLCHVLFPDSFERIFSQGNKFQVARAHKIWTPPLGESRPVMDAALLELRKRLELQHPGAVDYYALPVGTLIKEEATQPGKGSDGTASKDGAAKGSAALSAHEPDPEYDVETATNAKPTLRQADNLILFGPPGTGKTFEMQARMKAAFDKGEDFAFVAFHPSYAYEDFIGGLRPVAAKTVPA